MGVSSGDRIGSPRVRAERGLLGRAQTLASQQIDDGTTRLEPSARRAPMYQMPGASRIARVLEYAGGRECQCEYYHGPRKHQECVLEWAEE